MKVAQNKRFRFGHLRCRSPHGERGLKSLCLICSTSTPRRSPHGERGLKYIAEIVAVVVIERRYCLLGLILLSITAFTRVGASKVDHDAHGIVVEEHHAEHWAALSGAEPGHFPGKPIIISSLWETISDCRFVKHLGR